MTKTNTFAPKVRQKGGKFLWCEVVFHNLWFMSRDHRKCSNLVSALVVYIMYIMLGNSNVGNYYPQSGLLLLWLNFKHYQNKPVHSIEYFCVGHFPFLRRYEPINSSLHSQLIVAEGPTSDCRVTSEIYPTVSKCASTQPIQCKETLKFFQISKSRKEILLCKKFINLSHTGEAEFRIQLR